MPKPKNDDDTKRLSAYLPLALFNNMEAVRLNQKVSSTNQAIIDAVKLYVDQKGDIIGTRKHFSQLLENKLDVKLSTTLDVILYMFSVLIALMSSGLALTLTKLDILIKLQVPDFEAVDYDPKELLQDAMQDADRIYIPLKLRTTDRVQDLKTRNSKKNEQDNK